MFIVIEGIDGAGCETQAKLVFEKLQKENKKPELIKYPNYNNPVGKVLKNFLYDNQTLSAEQQFLLYSLQFIWDAPKIKKYQSLPTVLIADRYFTTTLCYQTLEGIKEHKALQFAENFGIIKPDLVFFLDVKPQIAYKRKQGEDKILNFREKDFLFIEKTYQKYLDLIKRQVWAKWVRINGEREPNEIAEEIISKI